MCCCWLLFYHKATVGVKIYTINKEETVPVFRHFCRKGGGGGGGVGGGK